MMKKLTTRLLIMLSLLGGAAQQGSAQEKRKAEQIIADINAANAELRGVLSSPDGMFDQAKRKEIAPKAIPTLRKILPLFSELAEADVEAREEATNSRFHFMALLSLLGDEETEKVLQAEATAGGPNQKLAQAANIVLRWWRAKADAAAQQKALSEMRTLATSNPQDPGVRWMLNLMPAHAASKELQANVDKLVKELLAQQKPKVLEGKPIVVEGVKLDGSKFSTADWKGKVILVEFWATWCGPCVADMPRVKKAYQQWHGKGLEIVGVSSDEDPAKLARYLDEHREMVWPQLFDPKKPGWHPLNSEYALGDLPVMFLIDRKGILRSVEAWETFEQLIPRLLDEK
jgi:thiol-disulfide isomerase/thioredoxin